METEVILSFWVREFVDALDSKSQRRVKNTIALLKRYGHKLSMPDAKPVGKGLWELRVAALTAIRILYGFCDGKVILLVAFKKQRNAIPRHEFELAMSRLKDYTKRI